MGILGVLFCQASWHESSRPPNPGDRTGWPYSGASKNVGEAVSARQKQAKKRSLRAVNEHLTRFAHPFGAALKRVQPTAVSLFLTQR
ncbi:MAG: hypothetical protein E2596_03485 [Pseudomonas sp.]|nr:hypothetical protein [Pseudomonas sp.]